MADRYLLESGGTDGYQLEDGSGVLLLETPPYAGDGDGEGWWAGAQQCFVAVALAGAAVALGASNAIAGTFNFNEDVAPLPPAVSSDASASSLPTQRLRHQAQFLRWYAQDDLPSPAPAALEADTWSAPVFVPQSVQLPSPAWDDQALAWKVDEQYSWSVPVVVPQSVQLPSPAWDDQALAWAVDEQYAWEAWKPTPLKVSEAFSSNEDLPLAASETATGGSGLPFYGQRERVGTRFQLWPAGDDLPVAAAAHIAEEDSPPTPKSGDSAAYIVWVTDEEIVPQPTSFPVDEAYWNVSPARLVPPILQVWSEDDQVVPPSASTVSGGGGLPFYGQRERVGARLQLWPASDDLPIPAVFRPVEEDAPATPRSGDSATYVVWASDDEIVPRPGLDENYWLQLYAVRVDPVVRVWNQQDEWEVPPPPLGVTDDYWLTFPFPPPLVPVKFPVDEDVPPLSKPPDTGTHSGPVRHRLIELYEKEWAAAQAKREREAQAELEARRAQSQPPTPPRPVKKPVQPASVPSELTRELPPVTQGEQGKLPPEEGPTFAEIVDSVMKDITIPTAVIKANNEATKRKRRQIQEEKLITMFINKILNKE